MTDAASETTAAAAIDPYAELLMLAATAEIMHETLENLHESAIRYQDRFMPNNTILYEWQRAIGRAKWVIYQHVRTQDKAAFVEKLLSGGENV